MPRGLWNWTNGAEEWARVEFELGQWGDMRRAEYEASGIAPPFLDLPDEANYLEAVFARFGDVPGSEGRATSALWVH